MSFDYADFTQRNLGFVTAQEQEALRQAWVLVIGVGGMGGAALQSLVRAGVGHLAIADFDAFEISNLNRQVFATLATVGTPKVAATAAQLLQINPGLQLETLGAEWIDRLDELLPRYRLVVNGMDDVAAGIALYRKAREHGTTVIDAYTSPLPSVIVVQPRDPRPEERLGYPSLGRDPRTLDPDTLQACVQREIEHVLVHSSSAKHIDLDIAKDLMSGKRKRMSFAPMVITAGNLMAFEAVKHLLGRRPFADCRGYFFNPWTMRTERPRSAAVAWAMRALVRRFLRRMLAG